MDGLGHEVVAAIVQVDAVVGIGEVGVGLSLLVDVCGDGLVEVNDGFRTPYVTSVDTIVPRYAIPQYQPGGVLNLMVDKDDPEKVAIIGS